MKYKWCPAVCPTCGANVQPIRTEAETPEPCVSIYPCWECEHPEVIKAERLAWEEADRKISEMVARGELLDCNGNPVSNVEVQS